MRNRIELGDTVRITFESDGAELQGRVDYVPSGPGDSWVIVLACGKVFYVQTFETMMLIKKAQKEAGQ